MKTIKLITLSLTLLSFLASATAQDDFYPSSKKKSDKDGVNIKTDEEIISEDEYSTATDYYIDNREKEKEAAYNKEMGITDSTTYYEDENGNVRITNNYYSGDNYDFENEYYDYEYSSRIKRFRRNNGRYGYYDDYYTNYYWYDYDPYYYGTSIYNSYGWWNPNPWGWNIGWSYYGGWSLGWSWGWGYTGNYGYCGTGYYGYNGYYGHHHHGHHGYNDGYYGGYYASNNYYNSYDHNSHYYGKRGGVSNYSGYGGRKSNSFSPITSLVASSSPVKKPRTFGQKYEVAVKNNTVKHNTNLVTTKPRVTGKNVYATPRTNGSIRSNTYNKPRTTPKSNTGYTKGKVYSKPGYSKPSSTSRPNYSKPKTTYNKPKNHSKPSYSKPSYSKPKSTYNKPKSSRPSYSKPSGSYNKSRSGGSKTKSSGGRRR